MIVPQCTKEIGRPILRTQHRPILCKVTAAIKPCDTPFLRGYNFQKADWNTFNKALDQWSSTRGISPPQNIFILNKNLNDN
jgi:hypothetical protein